MKTPKNKRQAFPVTSSIQYTFLALALAYGFIVVCFVAVANFVPDILEMQDQSLSPAIRSTAASRILDKNAWVLPACLSLVILLALHSFRAFQRVMGPLYRFRCAFEEFAKGNLLYPVKIRKKDYLHVEEQALIRMVDAFSAQINSIKNATETALHTLRELEKTATSSNPLGSISKDSLTIHRERLEGIVAAVRFFQVGGEGAELNKPSERS
jgi:methyl-accepting chemotaxis protein